MTSRADNVYGSKGTGSKKWNNYLNNKELGPAAASAVMTKYCNFRCPHCNVDAGPDGQETMTTELARKMVDEVSSAEIPLLILSGGEITLKPKLLLDTLRYSEEIGYQGYVIVQTNGSFAAGRSDGKVLGFLEALRAAGADGIEMTSDDSYHGPGRGYLRRTKNLAEKVFGVENVSTYGIRGPVVPIGRAEREVPRSEWSIGEQATFWNDKYNMHNLVKIDPKGRVYSCPWMSVDIGDLNNPLSETIEKARHGIAGKISEAGGLAKLDPKILGMSEEEFNSGLEQWGECGLCHRTNLKNGKAEKERPQ